LQALPASEAAAALEAHISTCALCQAELVRLRAIVNSFAEWPAGDYNRAEPGTADKRVSSETGCTCVLITSPSDLLG